MTDAFKLQRYGMLPRVFTPGAPVVSRDRFAGRLDQMLQVISGVNQPGMHVVLYGERGVGKTSLANVLADFLAPVRDQSRVAKVNCSSSDNYARIWKKILRELKVPVPEHWQLGPPDPDDVRFLLQDLPAGVVIVVDEYDRMEDDEGLSLMADTLKALSDHTVDAKLVIVGVADSIDALVGEHESVQRALVEVRLSRMTQKELIDIIDSGLETVDMTIEPQAARIIGRLAEGLPYFVHELSLSAAQRAVLDDRDAVSHGDVEAAINSSVEKHTMLKDYQTAVQSPRKENLYEAVLAAAALAEKDPLGYFNASAVRDPMSRIMGKPYGIPAFARHLNAFTESDRGRVLVREGQERRYRYRFRNPLLQPYTLLRAISEGLIPESYRKDLFRT